MIYSKFNNYFILDWFNWCLIVHLIELYDIVIPYSITCENLSWPGSKMKLFWIDCNKYLHIFICLLEKSLASVTSIQETYLDYLLHFSFTLHKEYENDAWGKEMCSLEEFNTFIESQICGCCSVKTGIYQSEIVLSLCCISLLNTIQLLLLNTGFGFNRNFQFVSHHYHCDLSNII